VIPTYYVDKITLEFFILTTHASRVLWLSMFARLLFGMKDLTIYHGIIAFLKISSASNGWRNGFEGMIFVLPGRRSHG